MDGCGHGFKIQRSDLDGSGVEDLVTRGLKFPYGLALGFVPVEAGPDLVVVVSVSDTYLTRGQSFKLSVTVRNQGTKQAPTTTLRYYRSDYVTIDATDTQIGTVAVDSLASPATRAYSIDLTAPTSTGVYYYGACVEIVSGETRTDNNCTGVGVVVLRRCYRGMTLEGGQSCITSEGRILTCDPGNTCTVVLQ